MEDEKRFKSVLEAEIFQLRLKKQDLETALRNVGNEKIVILGDIKNLKDRLLSLRKEQDELQKENSKLNGEMKDKHHEIVGEQVKVDRIKEGLANDASIIFDRNVAIEKKENELRKAKEVSKETTKKNNELQTSLNKQLEEVRNIKILLDGEKADLAKEKGAGLSIIKKQENAVQENFDKSLLLKEKYEAKLVEAARIATQVEKEKQDYELEKKNTENVRLLYEEKKKEAEEALQKAKNLELSNLRVRDAQDQKEKEIEIKKLRVNKIIREKNIEKELKELQKETS